jgi:hypothetical protein
MAKRVAGSRTRGGEPLRVALLDNVALAAERVRALEQQRQQAREDLRAKIRAARSEQIPFAAIARAAGLSRERVRQLYEGH